jgi:protein-L-isoaspartate O-methyltransferase
MNSKEFQLDIEALFSQIINGHGFLHYGYFEKNVGHDLTLARLGQAQLDYFNRLLKSLPTDTKSILDVGSGTGSNANALFNMGFDITCVCPSSRLNTIAREKLPNSIDIHETTFEKFSSQKQYDTILFAESFHYIEPKAAIQNIGKYAVKGALIFDYFPREGVQAAEWRKKHKDFIEIFNNEIGSTFKIVEDVDLTENIIPTFEILDDVKNSYIHPFVRKTVETFSKENPVKSFFLNLLLKKIIHRGLRRSERASSFLKTYEYRLIQINRVN